jgi:glucose-specific phosphotransferase system IIA component
MGLFDQLFKKGKNVSEPVCEPRTVYAPTDGTAIPLNEFPDPVFSNEVLGKGCGILPSGNVLYAPFNGTVTQVIDTLHAVGVTSDDGMELLMHIGVDTVDMNGKGFQCSLKENQRIKKGDVLITFDRAAIQAAGHPDAIAVVVTNSDEFSEIELVKNGAVESIYSPRWN